MAWWFDHRNAAFLRNLALAVAALEDRNAILVDLAIFRCGKGVVLHKKGFSG